METSTTRADLDEGLGRQKLQKLSSPGFGLPFGVEGVVEVETYEAVLPGEDQADTIEAIRL